MEELIKSCRNCPFLSSTKTQCLRTDLPRPIPKDQICDLEINTKTQPLELKKKEPTITTQREVKFLKSLSETNKRLKEMSEQTKKENKRITEKNQKLLEENRSMKKMINSIAPQNNELTQENSLLKEQNSVLEKKLQSVESDLDYFKQSLIKKQQSIVNSLNSVETYCSSCNHNINDFNSTKLNMLFICKGLVNETLCFDCIKDKMNDSSFVEKLTLSSIKFVCYAKN